MAVGDLSPAQARYASQVAQRTGLDPAVVVAWIGSESGWATSKAGSNYLNIGPGRQYQSVDLAAAAAADLVNSSKYYAGIRAAIPVGAAAQVAAIQASPWDAGHYGGHRLMDIFKSVAAGPGVHLAGPNGVTAIPVGLPNPLAPLFPFLPGLGDLGKGLANATGTNKIVGTAVNAIGGALLGLVFAGAALALIGLGLARLTGRNAGDIYSKLHTTTDQVAQVAKIAAVA